MWLIPAMTALLLVWPVVLTLPARLTLRAWVIPVGAVALGLVGLLLAPARFDDTMGQPLVYVFVVPVAIALLSLALFACTLRRDGHLGDLIALSIVGMISMPIVGLAEFHGATMLLFAAGSAVVGATVADVLLRWGRFRRGEPALAAGAFALPLVATMPAMVSWLVQPGLGTVDAVTLSIPAIAGVLAIVVTRLPRTWAGPVVAGVVLAVGLLVTLVTKDLSPYVAETDIPPAVRPWLGDWSSGPPAIERTPEQQEAIADEAAFWGSAIEQQQPPAPATRPEPPTDDAAYWSQPTTQPR